MPSRTSRSSNPVNIDIQIERWPIERLIPRANNPRTHSREQVAHIAASIREFGFTNPILVGADVQLCDECSRIHPGHGQRYRGWLRPGEVQYDARILAQPARRRYGELKSYHAQGNDWHDLSTFCRSPPLEMSLGCW